MHKGFRIAIWSMAVVVVLAGGVVLYAQLASEHKLQRRIEVAVAPVALPDTAAALERGRYLYETRGCTDCHGRDGAGRVFIDEDNGFRIKGPNLTSGRGSPTAVYRIEDWVRAIRHGVKPDGRPLIIMPSEDYNRLSDDDLGAMIAHIRALPPAEGDQRDIRLPLPVRLAYAIGIVRDAAEKIDHSLPPAAPVTQDDSAVYGAYVAQMCQGCHGENLQGGRIPGAPPDWPPAADLRPGGTLDRYPTADSFIAMMHSGKRPDGSTIQVMPFESLSGMDATEVAALYAYLNTLPKAGR